jgi:hypothetical protein
VPDPGPAAIPAAAGGLARPLLGGAGVGVLIGLGFAVKLTMALAGLGLALACLLAYRSGRARLMRRSQGSMPRDVTSIDVPGGIGPRPAVLLAVLAGLGAGFAVTAAAAIAVWGRPRWTRRCTRAATCRSGRRGGRSGPRVSADRRGIAEDVVKTAAVLVGIGLFVLLVRAFLRPPAPGPDGASGLPVVPLLPERSAGASSAPVTPPSPAAPAASTASVPAERAGTGPAALAGVGGLGWALVLAVAVAWLFAWPYVLPRYDAPGLGAAAAAPWSRLDWLMLARTTALAVGYLPARGWRCHRARLAGNRGQDRAHAYWRCWSSWSCW